MRIMQDVLDHHETAPGKWHRRVRPTARDIRSLRHELSRFLRERGLAEIEATAALLVDELLSNVALHSHTDAVVVVRFDGGSLHVEVHDGDGHMPVVRDPSPWTPSGRGLRIVGALADRWGTEREPGGKFVWFDLARRSA